MGASMSTAVGWAVVISVAGFFAYREWDKNQRRLAHRVTGQRLRDDQRHALQARKDVKEKEHTKPKRQRVPETPAAAPAASQSKANKESYATAAKTEQPKAAASQKKTAAAHSSDDEVDNREFARQLASVKQGTKFSAKAKDDVRQKSIKQSRAEEGPKKAAKPAPEEPKVSAPSSTAGIDADDDQSSAASPVVSAVNTAGDVSDMLEKPSPGPSVLRLTDTEDKNQSKSRPAKAAAPVESKKQRQNRKKAEAAKAQREEAEAQRKVLLEAQRRTARQAEGRAAQDGSGFMTAKAQGNVWTGSSKVNGGSNGHLPVQPLDTFDAETTDEAPAPQAAKPQKKATSGEAWMSSLPSEEEQIKMLREEESWSTVKTKTRKPKKKADEDSAAESTDDAVVPQKKAETAAPSASATSLSTAKPAATIENQRPVKTFSQTSSFAALNADGTADLAEEEEEWDV